MIDGNRALGLLRWLGQKLGVRGALLVVLDDSGHFCVSSWGRTRADCRELAPTCDAIGDAIEAGELPMPAWGER